MAASGPLNSGPQWLIPLALCGVAILALLWVMYRRNARLTRELSAREAHFRALIENSADCIALYNREKEPFYISPSVSHVLGYEPKEFLGPNRPKLIHPDDREAVVAAFERLATQPGELAQIEYRIRHKNGDWRWMDATAVNLFDDPNVGAIVVNFRDATARLEAEQTLSQELKARSDFVAIVSHEVRTPIHGILGMSRLLLESPLSAEQREFANAIRHAAKTLVGLVNEVLDLSRIEAGRASLDISPFDVRELLGEVIHTQQKVALDTVSLSFEVEPGLPEELEGDQGRIRRILTNLVQNAMKFTPKGHITLKAGCSISDGSKAHLRISVEDTGTGIPPDQLSGVFEEFTQATAATCPYGGSGLGLAIARKLVELMDGTISVSSILGKGTVFHVEMPLGLVQESWTPVEEPLVEEFRPLNLRLLLAEDNYINQRMMLHALEKYGCQVQLAQNGREALELALEHKYDAILMDCQMPEMDGYRATVEIRRAERERRTPIIALTAHALPGDREKCIASGMDDFLPKPVEFEQLVRTLQQWTGRELPLR